MKAWFIFRDGEVYGSPIGYTSKSGAVSSLRFCDDYHKLLHSYGTLLKKVPENHKEFYVKYGDNDPYWHIDQTKWSRKVWQAYVKLHYKIEQREFEVIIKN